MHVSGQVNALSKFKDGKPADGLQTAWHENGHKLGEGAFKGGKNDGLLTRWHGNGQKKADFLLKALARGLSYES